MTQQLGYTDGSDPQWGRDALETILVDAAPDVASPVVLDLHGACPRCRHDMTDEHWLLTIGGVAGTDRAETLDTVQELRRAGMSVSPTLPATFTVQCRCTEQHPDPHGRPALRGCGAAWPMRFELSVEEG